ncbi:TPA: helix-turn-helix domain-containing protein [Legionella pneumophila]|uniref:Helix-turn-helix domain-containing protein n=1 Tax=Legionella pneumophila TaxID=446 RepID=A0AAN5Q1R5_LEGPN|nr:helix-turn-helix domain-containing protein [Legionella pneumophila]HAT9238369.1 helix-turn-helix domain-containing protein [Legionella pneumophila subsp. pneumophila]MCH9153472.1 helix-turn-helix domain-containing protein [Legionella pneumophila serogroup 1]MCZ4759858.1 helix-turn-helix domain-containing protein [Legionella pneumophila]MDI9828827.1 helix-turn-helix domain-containing protein [Legionella pneumophila]MDW8853520.1 helix-turn-helix domain-containing protein [Legionella pneumophi
MIEQNKAFYQPDKVSAPGETLLDILEEREMSQVELSERIGRPLKTINEIIKGKAAITSETAIQLERALGTPAEFWNTREANYRAYIASQKELELLSNYNDWLKQFPIKEMIKRGWINGSKNVLEQTIYLLNFFGVATPEQWNTGWTKRKLAFRKAGNVNNDIGGLSVWLRKGEIEAQKIQCNPFNKELLLSSIAQIKSLTLEKDPSVFIPKLQNICAACGIAIVFIQPFPKVPAYGASCWLSPNKASIQLSLRGKTADILWFTIFHELGHIIKHSKKELFIEIDDKCKSKSPEEIEADEYANETLIPQSCLQKWLSKNESLTTNAIIEFSKELNIAPGIIVGRLQYLGKIKYSEHTQLKIRYEWQDTPNN